MVLDRSVDPSRIGVSRPPSSSAMLRQASRWLNARATARSRAARAMDQFHRRINRDLSRHSFLGARERSARPAPPPHFLHGRYRSQIVDIGSARRRRTASRPPPGSAAADRRVHRIPPQPQHSVRRPAAPFALDQIGSCGDAQRSALAACSRPVRAVGHADGCPQTASDRPFSTLLPVGVRTQHQREGDSYNPQVGGMHKTCGLREVILVHLSRDLELRSIIGLKYRHYDTFETIPSPAGVSRHRRPFRRRRENTWLGANEHPAKLGAPALKLLQTDNISTRLAPCRGNRRCAGPLPG